MVIVSHIVLLSMDIAIIVRYRNPLTIVQAQTTRLNYIWYKEWQV